MTLRCAWRRGGGGRVSLEMVCTCRPHRRRIVQLDDQGHVTTDLVLGDVQCPPRWMREEEDSNIVVVRIRAVGGRINQPNPARLISLRFSPVGTLRMMMVMVIECRDASYTAGQGMH